MSKLNGIKSYFQVDDAAKYLSQVWNERVAAADLFQAALSGELTISMDVLLETRVNPLRLQPVSGTASPQDEQLQITHPDAPEQSVLVERSTHSQSKLVTGVFDLRIEFPGTRIVLEQNYRKLLRRPLLERPDSSWFVLFRAPNEAYEVPYYLNEYWPFYGHSGADNEPLRDTKFCFAIRRAEMDKLISRTQSDVPSKSPPIPDHAVIFDPDAADYPELLHIATRAWDYAKRSDQGTPKQRILAFLDQRYSTLPKATKEAIAQVANWSRTGGRPAKSDE